jgi:ribonuclease HII
MNKRFSPDNILEFALDEAGRGCFAGPVVCAGVIMPPDYFNNDINDSKKLSKKKREKVYEDIITNAIDFSIVSIGNETIDEINILEATLMGWDRCIRNLPTKPDHIIVDGNRFIKDYHIPYTTMVKGDANYMNIAAASILAKVHKDFIMEDLHKEYPQYDWINNSAYGTKKHKDAIRKHGLSPYHRKSYKIKL